MTTEVGMAQWLLDHLWAPVAGIVGTVFALVNVRIGKIEKTAEAALPRMEFDGHKESNEQQRRETRDDMKELFGKVDDLGRDMNEKFNTLTTIILEHRK